MGTWVQWYMGTGVGIWVQVGYMGKQVNWHVRCLKVCIQPAEVENDDKDYGWYRVQWYMGTGVGTGVQEWVYGWVQGGYMGKWVQWHVGCLQICIQTDNDVGDGEIFLQKIFSQKIFSQKIFSQKIFLQNIFEKNIFTKNKK